jgi:hypothetical protein
MSVDEQEQMAGVWVLGKGGGHEARERIESFSQIGGQCVKEDSDEMREADHFEPPERVLACATAWTIRQASVQNNVPELPLTEMRRSTIVS